MLVLVVLLTVRCTHGTGIDGRTSSRHARLVSSQSIHQPTGIGVPQAFLENIPKAESFLGQIFHFFLFQQRVRVKRGTATMDPLQQPLTSGGSKEGQCSGSGSRQGMQNDEQEHDMVRHLPRGDETIGRARTSRRLPGSRRRLEQMAAVAAASIAAGGNRPQRTRGSISYLDEGDAEGMLNNRPVSFSDKADDRSSMDSWGATKVRESRSLSLCLCVCVHLAVSLKHGEREEGKERKKREDTQKNTHFPIVRGATGSTRD